MDKKQDKQQHKTYNSVILESLNLSKFADDDDEFEIDASSDMPQDEELNPGLKRKQFDMDKYLTERPVSADMPSEEEIDAELQKEIDELSKPFEKDTETDKFQSEQATTQAKELELKFRDLFKREPRSLASAKAYCVNMLELAEAASLLLYGEDVSGETKDILENIAKKGEIQINHQVSQWGQVVDPR